MFSPTAKANMYEDLIMTWLHFWLLFAVFKTHTVIVPAQ